MVMDKPKYDCKIYALLDDESAYQVISKDPMMSLRNCLSKRADRLRRQNKILEEELKTI